MKLIQHNIVPAVLVAGAIIVLALVLVFKPTEDVSAYPGFVGSGPFSTATTSQRISVTTSVRIMATTTGPEAGYTRSYASVCHVGGGTGGVWLSLDGDKPMNLAAASNNGGIFIASSTCYEITDRNLYQGSVQASSTNGTATEIAVQQFVY